MADTERRQRGAAMIKKVYAGDVVVPPAGASPFADVMLEQLFAEVWTREALSVRDRRLLIMGVIAALGEKDVFQITEQTIADFEKEAKGG
jgi:4-carboxymuconolactone decarboxylase